MRVEIWSDIICPWCYLGKRRFEHALAEFPHRDEVQVLWRSFELDPSAPKGTGAPLTEALAQKYGMSITQISELHDRLTGLAAAEGLEYHLDDARPGNTFDAHRLVHLAAGVGLQDAFEERLMRAYFSEGQPIGDRDTLTRLAVEVGLDEAAARAVLDGDAYGDAVRADEARAAQLGITGVPFFAIDERYGISGAQSSEYIGQALQTAWADAHQGVAPVSTTSS